MNLRIRGLLGFVLPLILVGCYGDWGTCRTDCQAGYHRNVFCDCDKNPPPGAGGGLTPPPPQGYLGRDFVWAATPHCSSNTIVYLFNTTNSGITAKYSYRNSSGNRVFNTMFVPSGFRGYDGAQQNHTVLGYNMVDDEECTLIGYQLEGPLAATNFRESESEALKSLQIRSDLAVEQARKELALSAPHEQILVAQAASTEIVKKSITPLNCSKECNPSPTINCLKSTPADQAKVKDLQESLLSKASGNISMSSIRNAFGSPPKGCEREDIEVTKSGLLNNGRSCSFPIYFSFHDAKPSVVVKYPETVSANKIEKDTLSKLEFVAPAEMPIITFRATDVNEVWGGVVIQASADDSGVYYQTAGGCIDMEVKK